MEAVNIAPEVSKEEKEKLLNEKMDAIRRRNEELRKRHEEIEADKKLADKYSASVQMEHVRPYVMKPHRPRPEKIYPVSDQNSINDESSISSSAQEMLLARQRLSQNEGPPPDPSYRFLADPDRDGSENTEDHQSGEGDNGRRGRRGRGRERGEGAFEERRGRGGGGFENERGRDRGEYEENERGRGSGRYEDNGRGRGGGFDDRNRGRGGYSGRSRGWEERGRGRGWENRGRGRGGNFRGGRGSSQEGGFRGTETEEDYYEENERGRGHHQRRGRAQRRNPGGRGQHRAYEQWKAERAAIDDERISRARSGDGEWRREWDLQKIDQEKQGVEEPVDYDPRYPRSKVEGFKLKDMLTEGDMKKLEEINIEKEEFLNPQPRGKGRGNRRSRGGGRRGGNERPQYEVHSGPVRNQDNWREVDKNTCEIPPFQLHDQEEEKIQTTFFEKRRIPEGSKPSFDGAATMESCKQQHKLEINKNRKKIFREKKTSSVHIAPESFGQSTGRHQDVNGHNEEQVFERFSCEEFLRESSHNHENNLQTEIAPDAICSTHDENESFNISDLSISLESTIIAHEVNTLLELKDESYSERCMTGDSLISNYIIPHQIESTADSILLPPEKHKEENLEVPICDVPNFEVPICDVPNFEVPICDVPNFEGPICNIPSLEGPICDVPSLEGHTCDVPNFGELIKPQNDNVSNVNFSDESNETKILDENKQDRNATLDHDAVSVGEKGKEYNCNKHMKMGENIANTRDQEDVLLLKDEFGVDMVKLEESSIVKAVDVLHSKLQEENNLNESITIDETVFNVHTVKEIDNDDSLDDQCQLEIKIKKDAIAVVVEGNHSKTIKGSPNMTDLGQGNIVECNKEPLLVPENNVENVVGPLQHGCGVSEGTFETCKEISIKEAVNVQNETLLDKHVEEIINVAEDYPISLESLEKTVGSEHTSSSVQVSKSDIEDNNLSTSVDSLKTLESSTSVTPNASVINRKLTSEKESPKKASSLTKNSSPSLTKVSTTKPVSKIIAKTPTGIASKVKVSSIKPSNFALVKTTTSSSLTKKILPKTIAGKIPAKSTIDAKPSSKLSGYPKSPRDLKSSSGPLKTTNLETSVSKRPRSTAATPVGSNLIEVKILEAQSSSDHEILASNDLKIPEMTANDTDISITVDSDAFENVSSPTLGCEVVPTNNFEVSAVNNAEIHTASDLKIPQSKGSTNIPEFSTAVPNSTEDISSTNVLEVSQADESISICCDVSPVINLGTLDRNIPMTPAETVQTQSPANKEISFDTNSKKVPQSENIVSGVYSELLEIADDKIVLESSLSDAGFGNSAEVSHTIVSNNPAGKVSEVTSGNISELLPTNDQIISITNVQNEFFASNVQNVSQPEVSLRDSFEVSPTIDSIIPAQIVLEENLKKQSELTQLPTEVHKTLASKVLEAPPAGDTLESLVTSKCEDKSPATNIPEISKFEASDSTVSEVSLTVNQYIPEVVQSKTGIDSCSDHPLTVDHTIDVENEVSNTNVDINSSEIAPTIQHILTENIPQVSQPEVTSLLPINDDQTQVPQIKATICTSSELDNTCDDVPPSIDSEIPVIDSDVSGVSAAVTKNLKSV